MVNVHSLIVSGHIVVGALALLLFWVPMLARKGSALHVAAGRWYVIAMYAVSATAFVASILALADPLGIRRPGETLAPERAVELSNLYRMYSLFLLMLSVLVFSSIRHGLAALRARSNPEALRSTEIRVLTVVLAALAGVVGTLGVLHGQILLVVFGALGLSAAYGMWRDARIGKPARGEILVAHLSGLIGSGIGAYTAFFAFGGARFLGEFLPGQWQVIPWVLPAIIGTIAIGRLKRPFTRMRQVSQQRELKPPAA